MDESQAKTVDARDVQSAVDSWWGDLMITLGPDLSHDAHQRAVVMRRALNERLAALPAVTSE